MKIYIYYYKTYRDRPLESWDVRVNYKKQYPTKEDLKTGYAKLPIPQSFWKNYGATKVFVPNVTLDDIFRIMNNYSTNPMAMKSNVDRKGSKMQDWLIKHGVLHTSISVGDVVIINGKMYICDSLGWKERK